MLALAGSLLGACATTQLARPLGRGNTRVALSLGGPLVAFGGAPVPLPVSVLGIAHGLSDAVDVQADLHPTAAAFGIAGLDLGVAWHPLSAHRSALTLGAALYGFGNGADATVLADLWVAAGLRPVRWLWLGAGLHNGLRLLTSSSELREQMPWAPTPFVQAAFRPGMGRVELEVELRWYALASCGSCAAPDYYSPGGPGALGVLLGLTYSFAGGHR